MTDTERIAHLEAQVRELRHLVAELLVVAVKNGDLPITDVRTAAALKL